MSKENKECKETVVGDPNERKVSFFSDMDSLLSMASPALRKSIEENASVAYEARKEIAEGINSVEGVSFCDKFVAKNTLNDLKKVAKLSARISSLEVKVKSLEEEKSKVASFSKKSADFSLNAPSIDVGKEDELDYIPIRKFNLT